MKIVVCMKPVPSSEARVSVASDGKSIDLAGASMVVNPYDEYAIEEALKLKEAGGAGEVIVLTVGPASAATVIRTPLATGADRAILLKSAAADGLQVSEALAAKLRELSPDLILLGKQAIDDDGAQVGQRLGELLGLPCVSVVTKLEIAGGKVRAEREIEGGVEVCECSLPAIITAQKGLNEPRYPSLKGIMAAKKKEIAEADAAPGAAGLATRSSKLPAGRSAGRIIGEGKDAVPELVRVLREEARVI